MSTQTPEPAGDAGAPEGPDSHADAGAPDDESPVMDMLGEHVPLSLIMDLSAPAGPDSESILDDEGQPEDAWWESGT